MYIPYGQGEEHAKKLKAGLEKLGSSFTAELCYWCKGTLSHKFENCHVCCRDRPAYSNNGLLQGGRPAPDSVAYQVLNAAEKC